MKVTLLLAMALFMLFRLDANGQRKPVETTKCNISAMLHFKGRVDSLQFDAIFDGLVINPKWEELKRLENEGRLKSADFKYVITFRLKGCEKIYAAPSCDVSAAALKLYDARFIGKTIHLSCVAYQHIINKGEPFFIVNKARLVTKR